MNLTSRAARYAVIGAVVAAGTGASLVLDRATGTPTRTILNGIPARAAEGPPVAARSTAADLAATVCKVHALNRWDLEQPTGRTRIRQGQPDGLWYGVADWTLDTGQPVRWSCVARADDDAAHLIHFREE